MDLNLSQITRALKKLAITLTIILNSTFEMSNCPSKYTWKLKGKELSVRNSSYERS